MDDTNTNQTSLVPVQQNGHIPMYKRLWAVVSLGKNKDEAIEIEDEDGDIVPWPVSHRILQQRQLVYKWSLFVPILFTAPTTYLYLYIHLGHIYGIYGAAITVAILELSAMYWYHLRTRLSENQQQNNTARFMCYVSIGTVLALFYDSVSLYLNVPSFFVPYLGIVLVAYVILLVLAVYRYNVATPDVQSREKRMDSDGISPDSDRNVKQRSGVKTPIKRLAITPEQWLVITSNSNNEEVAQELGKSISWVYKARKQGVNND